MKKSNISGQSLFEVVVALAISALIVFALVSLVSSSIRNANFSKNKSVASTYAQEAIEWLRGERDMDIAGFITNTQTPSWCFANLDWNAPGICPDEALISETIFKRTGAFTTTSVSGKSIIEANVTVSWIDAQGTHQVENVTNFSDWRER